MAETLENRVEELERRVAELADHVFPMKDPWRTYGVFKNDSEFEEAIRIGREYREQQTYDKEIAGS